MYNKKFYTLVNFIIYILTTILLILISYNIVMLYKKYNSPKIPSNSVKVSPNYKDETSDVLLND